MDNVHLTFIHQVVLSTFSLLEALVVHPCTGVSPPPVVCNLTPKFLHEKKNSMKKNIFSVCGIFQAARQITFTYFFFLLKFPTAVKCNRKTSNPEIKC